ncbi:unnamed protein product [Diplocarpon coronariae]
MANTKPATLDPLLPVDRPSWKMFPKLGTDGPQPLPRPVGLAEDFEKWMQGWSWSWGKGGKQAQRDGVREHRVGANQGNLKPPGQAATSPCKDYIARHSIQSTPSSLPAPSPSTSHLSPPFYRIHSASPGPACSRFPALMTPPSPTPSHSPAACFSPSSSASSSSSSDSSTGSPLFTTEYFEARRSSKGGYGAFALDDIEEGTVVLKEKALFKASFVEVFSKLEGLTCEERREYRTLHGYEAMSHCRDLAIYKTNRFDTPGGKGGIFLRSSRFNHACHPYATCKYLYSASDDCITFTACKPIQKNQEITISYTNTPSQLPGNYGFYCDCPACPTEQEARRLARFLQGPRQRAQESCTVSAISTG